MSNLNFSVKLLDTNQSINRQILNALLPDLTSYFNNIYSKMKKEIPPIIINYIKAQPEYTSLTGGRLMAEFGLPDASSRLSNILSTIENGTIVNFKPPSIKGNKIQGSIRLQMIKTDFADLLSLGDASLTTEKGTKLDWLKWLLTEGDTAIISDYTFSAGANKNSRTGLGIMKEFSGAFWRVPPEFAGTIKNNWITRAIEGASSSIDQVLQRLLRN